MSIKSGLYGAVVGACATLIITSVVLVVSSHEHRPNDTLSVEEYFALQQLNTTPTVITTPKGQAMVIMGDGVRTEAMQMCNPTNPRDGDIIIASPHDRDFWTCVTWAESNLRYHEH